MEASSLGQVWPRREVLESAGLALHALSLLCKLILNDLVIYDISKEIEFARNLGFATLEKMLSQK